MIDTKILDWLLEGDVAIQYQVHRDLLDDDRPDLRSRIAQEGWGAGFLEQRRSDSHWGDHYYQPKWTSTHYTLIDLKNLAISPTNEVIRETIALVLETNKADDGGIHPIGAKRMSDLCIDGMFLNVACYFKAEEGALNSLIDLLIDTQMGDGGYNCRVTRGGAHHSSMHTTISVLEGFQEYLTHGYTYRRSEIQRLAQEAGDFLLQHHLFRSDHTGEIIEKRFLMLSFPARWYYDILRALDYFQFADAKYDPRMSEALEVLKKKRRKDGTWPVQAKHPGQTHLDMERTGGTSRWNTLRALRVAIHFGWDI